MDNTQKIKEVQQVLDPKVWIVEDILGGGTFSFGVFRAREVLSENYYAVKVVEFNSDGQDRYRRREIGLLIKDLSNRNVIRHHHEWTTKVGNTTYLCFKMELCLNNLCDYMTKKKSMVNDENFYKVVFPQILNGLEAIHSIGWVHRDISLTNILVQLPIPRSIREIKIKIGSFMLARRLSSDSSSNLSDQATLEKQWPRPRRALYQAPEMSGENYCEKADLYSAGIVLYLLASSPQERESWPDDEIRALREKKRGRSHLCHDNTVLHDLLFSEKCSLLHSDPVCRPSAEEALRKLPLQREPLRNHKEKNTTFVHAAIAAAEDKLELVNDSLGKGSYGRVVSVKHTKDNNLYAVKIITSSPDNPEKYKKRELAILTRQVDSPTMHDNIVRYYNSWEFPVEGEAPALCIRLELCDKNLDQVLKDNQQIVDQDVFHKHVFKQILEALQYLHEKCWVHRDIHPGNILMKIPSENISSWVVKLADFGLARELHKPSLTVPDPPMAPLSRDIGNRLYRAPEIDTANTYDCKVDMYSAGLVLFRLCCYSIDEEKIKKALQDVKMEGIVNKNVLCHTNEVLYQLMNDLVKHEPDDRPSALKAKIKFDKYTCSKDPSLADSTVLLSLDETDAARAEEYDEEGVLC